MKGLKVSIFVSYSIDYRLAFHLILSKTHLATKYPKSPIKTLSSGKAAGYPIENIDAFSAESINFSHVFSALKVKHFQPNFATFFTLFSQTVKCYKIQI